jgi:hypothetical protein
MIIPYGFFVRKPTDAPISKIYFVMKLYMFRTFRLSIISSLFTVHSAWYMSYSFRAGPGWNCSSILVLLESYSSKEPFEFHTFQRSRTIHNFSTLK